MDDSMLPASPHMLALDDTFGAVLVGTFVSLMWDELDRGMRCADISTFSQSVWGYFTSGISLLPSVCYRSACFENSREWFIVSDTHQIMSTDRYLGRSSYVSRCTMSLPVSWHSSPTQQHARDLPFGSYHVSMVSPQAVMILLAWSRWYFDWKAIGLWS